MCHTKAIRPRQLQGISSLANCFSPLAMILTGLVIGGYDIKSLLKNKRVYLLTLVRCILLPLPSILWSRRHLQDGTHVHCLCHDDS